MNRTSPVTPPALGIADALQRSEPLTRLVERLQDSRDRLAAIRASLPGAIASHVTAGPVDEEGWSLIAANPAVAAKLRQLQPRLEAVLREKGWPVATLRIKIGSR